MSGRDDDLMRGRTGAPVKLTKPAPQSVQNDTVRARQKGRAIVMALLLGAFVVLIFAITIAKMKHGG